MTGDFIVTLHALDRMGERFPDLISGLSDDEVGHLVMQECIDAAAAGRSGPAPPIEFSLGRWRRQPGSFFCWNADRTRSYALADTNDATHVLTVLVGVARVDTLGKTISW